MLSLLNDAKITRVENAASAGTSDVDTDVLDMAGYDAVAFVAALGDVTNTSVLALSIRQSDNSDGSSSSAITGASAGYTAAASDADNKLLVTEVIRPSKRYVFARLARGTANAVVDSIVAIQHRAKSLPVTQGSTVLASALAGPVN